MTTPMPSSSNPSEANSDGTLRLLIQRFANMAETVRGPCKNIENVPWRIVLMPRQHVVHNRGTQKCLGFFLECCPQTSSEYVVCSKSQPL
uniref:MATH domain-containing protein n=1 Tax=Steinernema glaseri TaxID=37863 RepID=A0A1I7Z140_9BILA